MISDELSQVGSTKADIQAAFLDILNEKDFDKIAVTEVCRRAGIHRTTFYGHFHRIDDVLKAVCDQVLDEVDLSCWMQLQERGRIAAKPLCQYVRNHPESRALLIDHSTLEYFVGRATARYVSSAERFLKRRGIARRHVEPVLLHFIHGCIGVTLHNVNAPEGEWLETRNVVDAALQAQYDVFFQACGSSKR